MLLYLSSVSTCDLVCIMRPPIPWKHNGFGGRAARNHPQQERCPESYQDLFLSSVSSPRPVLWPDTLMWSLEKSPREIGGRVGVLQDGDCVLPLWVTVLRAKQLPLQGGFSWSFSQKGLFQPGLLTMTPLPFQNGGKNKSILG